MYGIHKPPRHDDNTNVSSLDAKQSINNAKQLHRTTKKKEHKEEEGFTEVKPNNWTRGSVKPIVVLNPKYCTP